jgi:hypothetical protein
MEIVDHGLSLEEENEYCQDGRQATYMLGTRPRARERAMIDAHEAGWQDVVCGTTGWARASISPTRFSPFMA